MNRAVANANQGVKAMTAPPIMIESVKILPFDHSDADYAAGVAVHNAVWPEYPETVADWKRWAAQRSPQYIYRRFLTHWGDEAGPVVAEGVYMHTFWAYHPQRFLIDINVRPEYQGRGIGAAMYEFFMAELAPYSPTSIEIQTYASRPQTLRFLDRLGGYELKTRMRVSHLDLNQFDPDRFAPTVQRVEAGGIVIRPLSALLADDPDCRRKLYEMSQSIQPDIPWHAPFSRPTLEEWLKRFDGNAEMRLDKAYLVAMAGDRYVGVTMLFRSDATDAKLFTGLTGVIREYRRRGIALALKVKSLSYALTLRTAEGNRPIVATDNEQSNPMFDINIKLGFVPQPDRLVFVKTLAA